jgi:hypothetical protein
MVILGLGGIITDAAAALVKAAPWWRRSNRKVARYSRPGQTP